MSEPTPRKLTPEDLAAIDARAKAATPGPWNVIESQLESDYTNEDFWFVRFSFCAQPFESKDSTLMDKSDATFIAHAREDVPRLLAHAAALEADLQRGREALDELLDALGEVNLCCADVDEKRKRCFTHRENLPCPYDWIREAQAKANAFRQEVPR